MFTFLHTLTTALNATLVRIWGDWGHREMCPQGCITWGGFLRSMTSMCAATHLRPEHFATSDRPERRGAFGNEWGI